MSALGHKRTFAVQKGMSALLPKADMCGALAHVCFVTKADIPALTQSPRPLWRSGSAGLPIGCGNLSIVVARR